MASFHALDWTPLDDGARDAQVGDLVSADAGGMPIYKIITLEPGRAWVEAWQGAQPQPMPLERFQWRGRDS